MTATAIRVSSATRFDDATVDGCVIERRTLESLTDYGRLTRGQRMTMIIVDAVSQLRASFSGFQMWIHLIALALFLFPYAWFVASQWAHARFGFSATTTIPLWEALLRYILAGGDGWQQEWRLRLLPFAMFVISCVYNVVRAVLLWKTKGLELQQEASGLPANFSMTGKWWYLYQAARYGLWINFLVVLVHPFHFMNQRVPIE